MLRKWQILSVLILAISVLIFTAVSSSWASTITVSNTNDSGAGSLREAIIDAASGDTINFGVTGTITLTSGELFINKDLTITGPGATSLAISGNNNSQVFAITQGVVTMSGITVRDGYADSDGGGISNYGTLTLNHVTVTHNTAIGGGGIFNKGGLTLNNAVISDNSAFCDCHAYGGGLYSVGSTVLHNVTVTNNTVGTTGNYGYGSWGAGVAFSGNYTFTIGNATFDHNSTDSHGSGGGIYVDWYEQGSPPDVRATNLTIASNTAAYGGGGIYNYGTVALINATVAGNSPDGLWSEIYDSQPGTFNVRNTILASNSSANCSGTTSAITSLGHNLDSGKTCGFGGAGDIVDTDPLLESLADNGGPTQTMALQPGSAAIDAADPNNFPATDQRGIVRPQGAAPDMGAYEYVSGGTQTLPLSLTLNKSAYSTGDPLSVDLTIANPGSQLLADVYFGILLPASAGPSLGCQLGNAILFLANGLTSASIVCASDPIQSFPRAFAGLTLPASLPVTDVKHFFGFLWPQGAPAGQYQMFMLLTRANALLDGSADPGDVVGLAAAPMSFSP